MQILFLRSHHMVFVGAFAKLRKADLNFVMSACLSIRPSVRMEQLGSHWREFYEILYLNVAEKFVEKIQFSLNSEKNRGD